MTRFSNTLLALPLLLSGCLVSHTDQPYVADAALPDDAGVADAAPLAQAAVSPSVADQAVAPGRASVGNAAHVAAPALDAARPEPASDPVTEDAAHWEREVQPAKLDATASDPTDLERKACRSVMSESELCACLTGPIEPEYADSYHPTCSHHALGVPGFGVFTDRNASSYVTAQKDGGWYQLAYVDSAGYSSFGVSGARLMRAGNLSVLAIQMSQSSGCTNDGWDLEVVQLCALREPGSAHFGRCVSVPVHTLWSTWLPETDETVEKRSRLSFQLTSRGTVVVRARGKIRHDDVRKALGEHSL